MNIMHSIAHIINPFIADKSSDLYTAQPITFASMINAKQKAKDVISVELYTAQFEEDKKIIPKDFNQTENLNRSVLTKNNFNHPIKLPFIIDILERLYNASKAEYLIYSNVDIGLYPDFYLKVNKFIDDGYDAFIINRRRLTAQYKSVDDLKLIENDFGKSHPGFDCFIFHRDLFPKFKLNGICIGVPFIEISFSQNLFALSENFKLYENENITFHIGMEIYKKRAPKEYFDYNKIQFWNLVPLLYNNMDLEKFPYSNRLWPIRFIKWALHPCIPIRLVVKLEIDKLLNRK